MLSSGENTTGCFDLHTASKPDEAYFIACTDATKQILHTMARYNGKCPLCGFSLDTESLGFLRHGHAARISLSCAAGHSLRWFSSSVISGKFTVNLRYVTYLVNFDEVDTNFMGSTKTWNPESGNGNGITGTETETETETGTETETEYGIKYQ